MKMKTIIYLTLLVLQSLILSCATPVQVAQADLVFLGTVEKLEASPLPHSTANWIVHCRVDQVLSGNFSGKTFSFRVHSPAKSGLEVGRQHKIEAKRTTDGYSVDQYQWEK
jgi:hypothetical protein